MRKDKLFWTVAAMGVLLACAGLAARSGHVPVAGRVIREGFHAAAGTRGLITFLDVAKKAAFDVRVECREACSFRGSVPPGSYRIVAGIPFALPGHTAIVRERLAVSGPQTDLRFELAAPVTVSGPLDAPSLGCPERLPTVTFRRTLDGEEFGAAVTCAAGGEPGFAALLEPGSYDVTVELPDGRSGVARDLHLRNDVVDLPLGILLPAPAAPRMARF